MNAKNRKCPFCGHEMTPLFPCCSRSTTSVEERQPPPIPTTAATPSVVDVDVSPVPRGMMADAFEVELPARNLSKTGPLRVRVAVGYRGDVALEVTVWSAALFDHEAIAAARLAVEAGLTKDDRRAFFLRRAPNELRDRRSFSVDWTGP